MPRLPRRDDGRRGPPARLDPVKAAAAARLAGRAGVPAVRPCRAAAAVPRHLRRGPARTWSRTAGYPSTQALTSWHSIGTLLLAKCARKPRVSHAGTLADDEGLAFALGLTALPKTTHLGTYSWRVRREANQKLLTGLVTGAAAARAGHRRGRVQLRLPRHPPPRRPGRAGKALRPPPLPAHPRRADLLRARPRHRRHGLRQRRHHQGRAGRRDHRLRRLLAAGHRHQTPGCWSSTPS